ncbi:uncharacterized protein EV420DRAFT_1552970 [Desarmillaria tabescens]|uniref:Methyltransferase n=1 Tax=Armillaria tabescens TaxID=1929756 RepID=A0AA39N2F9_ARMTA|nr:uncharacterized protein EV420DRAFT_1552970 [Desarmillaria tabescens]KAK0455746.1 hypothetical protein EV420DRAFT_1552970 [Desarmillaria tabescens]
MSSGVTADLFFMQPPANGERAYTAINAQSPGKRDRNYSLEKKAIHIENYREKQDPITLDTAGFQLISDRPTQFIKDGEVQVEGYYEESIAAIKESTGASRVVLFDHTIRRRRLEETEDTPEKRQPVASTHVDQTPKSAATRVHRHLPPEDVPKLLSKRFQIINLWRPIQNPAIDWPLALCHFASVDPEKDVEPVTLKYPHMDGETYGIKYNERQKWGYFKDVRPDEFVLIKWFVPCLHDETSPTNILEC